MIRLIGVLCALLVLRLVSLWFNNSELFFDEAQYWAWSRQLEFGYFSKPPFLAWTIAVFTGVCGNSSEFCIRLPAPIYHFGTSVLLYLIGSALFNRRVGFWAGVLFAVLPAVSLSSTIISTDATLLFFWAFSLLAFIRLQTPNSGLIWGVLLGFALGLGMLSKYAMAYFFLCCAVYAMFGRPTVKFWQLKPFWVAIVIGLILFSGNIVWNLSNDLTTISHTGENIGWAGIRFNFKGVLEFFGAQFGVFGPILMGIFIAALFQWRIFGGNENQRLLVSFSLPILTIIIVQAFVSKAYANWAALTYVAATVLVAQILVETIPKKWLKMTLALHLVLFIGLSVAVTRAGHGELNLPGGAEPFERMQGAAELTNIVKSELENGNYAAVVTAERRTSSLLTYGLRDAGIDVLAWRRTQIPDDYYEQRQAYQDDVTSPVLVVIRKKAIAGLNGSFGSVEKIGYFPIYAGKLEGVELYRAANPLIGE